MKKFTFTAAFLFVSGATALGQTGAGYRVDNFDFVNGIRVETPKTQLTSYKASRKKLRRGAPSASAESINAIIDTRMAEIKGASSLGGYTTGNATIDSLIVESGT